MAGGYGAYGKIPALGDFFRLNLPQAFVETWDRWLQGAMADARAHLGPAWEAAYMSAHPWRFSLMPGLAGVSAMAGVLVPSVDRVGRKFPLTLAHPILPSEGAAADHAALLTAAGTLEEVALDAVATDMGRDDLADRLAACPAPVRGGALPPARHLALRGRDLLATDGADLSGWSSVWSCEAGGAVTVLRARGLPPEGLLSALFDPQTIPNGQSEGFDA